MAPSESPLKILTRLKIRIVSFLRNANYEKVEGLKIRESPGLDLSNQLANAEHVPVRSPEDNQNDYHRHRDTFPMRHAFSPFQILQKRERSSLEWFPRAPACAGVTRGEDNMGCQACFTEKRRRKPVSLNF